MLSSPVPLLAALGVWPVLLGVVVSEAPPLVVPEAGALTLTPDAWLPAVPVDASLDVAVPDVPGGAFEPPVDPLEVDGRLSSTSPLDVPVVVPLGEVLPVVGTQVAALVVAFACVPDVAPDMVLDEAFAPPVVAPAVLPLAAAEVSLVDGVVPVPLAPFVVFSPVNR